MTSISPRSSFLLRTISRPFPKREEGRLSPRGRAMAFVAATVIAGAAALVLGMWLAGDLSYSYVDMMAVGGINNLTGWAVPAFKLVMDVSSIGVIGLLLTCLLLPVQGRELGTTARHCLRTAVWLALVWSVSTAALLVFSWSDVTALPVTALPVGKLFTDTSHTFPDAPGFMTSTALALVIAVGVSLTKTRLGALILLPLAVYGLVPMTLEGNASHSTVIMWSVIVHVSFVSLWVGGLAALVTHVRREPELLAVAVPRFSTVAGVCYFAVAASGIVGAFEMLGYTVSPLWGSRYGVIVMLKAGALIALGVCGWWHRRRTVRRIRDGRGSGARRAFIRLAAAEVVVMVVAVALGVVLSRTSSPDMIQDNGRPDSGMSIVHDQPGIRV